MDLWLAFLAAATANDGSSGGQDAASNGAVARASRDASLRQLLVS